MLRLCVAAIFISLTVSAAKKHPGFPKELDDYPHARCTACRVLGNEIVRRMETSSKLKKSIQKGHRLDQNNKVQRVDYASSELRAIELTQDICERMPDFVRYKEDPDDGVRYFTINETWKIHKTYSKKDREVWGHYPLRHFKNLCDYILDKHDKVVVGLIRADNQNATDFNHVLCNKKVKCCDPESFAAGVERELKLRGKYLEKIREKEDREQMQRDLERAEKEAAEAKKKLEAEELLKAAQAEASDEISEGQAAATDLNAPSSAAPTEQAAAPAEQAAPSAETAAVPEEVAQPPPPTITPEELIKQAEAEARRELAQESHATGAGAASENAAHEEHTDL